MTIDNNKPRIEYIDIAKALAILCMVLEHAETVNDFVYYIAAFHVPIFFFISGFLFKRGNITFADYLKKKARSLLLPYIVFGVAHYLFWLYRSDVKTLSPLIAILTGNVLGFPIAGSLWFLTALFISELIYFLIDKYSKSYTIHIILVIIIALFGCIVPSYLPFTTHYAFAQGCVGVGLMELGRTLQKNEKLFTKIFSLKWYVWVVVTVLTAFLIRCNDVVHMFIASFGNIPLFWINVTLSILIVFKLSIWLNSAVGNTIIGKYLKDTGRNSIVFLCLNNITINISRRIIGIFGLTQQTVLGTILLIVLMLSLLHFEALIITKTKLRIIIGK